MATCLQCERPATKGELCYAHFLKSVTIGFGSGMGSKSFPSQMTGREMRDKMIKDARANGVEPEPAGSRWV